MTNPRQRSILSVRKIQDLWWHLHEAVTATDFSEAQFQAVLSIARVILEDCDNHGEGNLALWPAITKSFEGFKNTAQLKSGLSMEQMWQRFKPDVPTSYDISRGLSHLYSIADRFDAVVWRVEATLSDLALLYRSISDAIRDAKLNTVTIEPLIEV